MGDADLALALKLQEEYDEEYAHSRKKSFLDISGEQNPKLSVTDPSLEYTDPTPDIYRMFVNFDKRFFWSSLGSVEVMWSPRMTSCAGICRYRSRSGATTIHLSLPLLKLRPRKDLVETLLHEMIHAYLFVTKNNKDRDGHGPEFQSHMHRINKCAGTKITIYHSFHAEVSTYKTHWWRCNGPCQYQKPFYGLVKRSMNRAPGPNDLWYADHQRNCGGVFVKVKEPENFNSKKNRPKQSSEKRNSSSPLKTMHDYFKKANTDRSGGRGFSTFTAATTTTTVSTPITVNKDAFTTRKPDSFTNTKGGTFRTTVDSTSTIIRDYTSTNAGAPRTTQNYTSTNAGAPKTTQNYTSTNAGAHRTTQNYTSTNAGASRPTQNYTSTNAGASRPTQNYTSTNAGAHRPTQNYTSTNAGAHRPTQNYTSTNAGASRPTQNYTSTNAGAHRTIKNDTSTNAGAPRTTQYDTSTRGVKTFSNLANEDPQNTQITQVRQNIVFSGKGYTLGKTSAPITDKPWLKRFNTNIPSNSSANSPRHLLNTPSNAVASVNDAKKLKIGDSKEKPAFKKTTTVCTVACPVCNLSVNVSEVNQHLDLCLTDIFMQEDIIDDDRCAACKQTLGRKCNVPTLCSICEHMASSYDFDRPDTQSDDCSITCPMCETKMIRSDLERHLELCIGIEDENNQTCICDEEDDIITLN